MQDTAQSSSVRDDMGFGRGIAMDQKQHGRSMTLRSREGGRPPSSALVVSVDDAMDSRVTWAYSQTRMGTRITSSASLTVYVDLLLYSYGAQS